MHLYRRVAVSASRRVFMMTCSRHGPADNATTWWYWVSKGGPTTNASAHDKNVLIIINKLRCTESIHERRVLEQLRWRSVWVVVLLATRSQQTWQQARTSSADFYRLRKWSMAKYTDCR
jgi:hypothetical protein